MIWTTAMYLSLAIFIALMIVVIIKLKKLKYRYESQKRHAKYRKLTQIQSTYLAGNFNRVYKNHLDSMHIIDQFIISEEEDKSFLLCNFTKDKITSGALEICIYNIKGLLIYTLIIKDIESFKKAKFVDLPPKSKYVNIYFHKENEKVDNLNHLHANKLIEYQKVAKIESIALFFLLLPIADYALSLIFAPNFILYQNILMFFLVIVLIGLACVFNYISTSIGLSKQQLQGDRR